MEQNVVLEMRDISKNFTGVRALSHVDFTLRKGEIHALMGENGAGKSTLIKVLTGVHEFESGTIHMAGNSNAIINHSPQEAQANGISTVYQEVNLCPNLTVAENLFIGREPRKMAMIDWKQMNERSGKLLESLDIHVPPTQMLDECSILIKTFFFSYRRHIIMVITLRFPQFFKLFLSRLALSNCRVINKCPY